MDESNSINKNACIESILEDIPKETLDFLRMLFVLNLIDITDSEYVIIDLFSNTNSNFFDNVLSFKNNICKESVSINSSKSSSLLNPAFVKSINSFINFVKTNKQNYCTIINPNYRQRALRPLNKSLDVNTSNSITSYLDSNSLYDLQFDKLFGNIINEKNTVIYNQINYATYENYINLIDNILNRKTPSFNEIPDSSFFDNVTITDLLKIHIILESDFISLIEHDEKTKIGQFEYLDLTDTNLNNYATIMEYYKNRRFSKKITLDFSDLDIIFKEKDDNHRIYKISAYYKYLIEHKKIDIIIKLRELLQPHNTFRGIPIREHFFISKYIQKVNEIPYSNNTKEIIQNIINYILNYHYIDKTPYIPVNFILYTEDKETVEKIANIIGEFMWFFGYLPESTKYYRISEITSYSIRKLYSSTDNNVNGVVILNNFNQLASQDNNLKNEALNTLIYEIQKNTKKFCTFIYGDKNTISHILNENIKSVLNIEIDFDYLSIEQIYNIVIRKIEQTTNITEKEKNKLLKYINSTYPQSEIKNYEYITKLYNEIMLNMNNTFNIDSINSITLEDIPDAYNTDDLPETLKSLNSLVGLEEIKEQINDLVSLLRFYKKANIDLKTFNLHMIFKGNPRNW